MLVWPCWLDVVGLAMSAIVGSQCDSVGVVNVVFGLSMTSVGVANIILKRLVCYCWVL